MRILGLDPGLQNTGWGIVETDGNRLRHVANGTVHSDGQRDTATRLLQIFEGLTAVIAAHAPTEAAVEETFVNKNASSTLKLGLARGIALLAPARAGLPVAEYAAKVVKKSLVGVGGADKHQVAAMLRHLLPGVDADSADASDALAVAICHAHHSATQRRWAGAGRVAIADKCSVYVPDAGPARRRRGRSGLDIAPSAVTRDLAGEEDRAERTVPPRKGLE